MWHPMSASEIKEKLGTPFLYVLAAQMEQVFELRHHLQPECGRLVHFRKALDLLNQRPLSCAVYPMPIFATLQDIESLEMQIRNGDYTDFIIQCCAICEVYQCFDPLFETRLHEDLSTTWIFAYVRDIEDIAKLCYRLRKISRYFNITYENHIGQAFNRLLNRGLAWQEYLMLFRGTNLPIPLRVFATTGEQFDLDESQIPPAALSLFLSYSTAQGIQLSPSSEMLRQYVILKLVEHGASLRITYDDHDALFRELKTQSGLADTPWWLEPEDPVPGMRPRTSLCRLMELEWDQPELYQLARNACFAHDPTDFQREDLQLEKPRAGAVVKKRRRENVRNFRKLVQQVVKSKRDVRLVGRSTVERMTPDQHFDSGV